MASQTLDNNALNIIQRAIKISNQQQGKKDVETMKNLLDITSSPLVMSFQKAVMMHLIPGIISFISYNFIIRIFPIISPLIAFYLSCMLFVVPFEILVIMHFSKFLSGSYIPPHLSSIFLFWPPHISELQTKSQNTKHQKDKGNSFPTILERINVLFNEFVNLLRVFDLSTLLFQFFWSYAAFTIIGPHEAAFFSNTIFPWCKDILNQFINSNLNNQNSSFISQILGIIAKVVNYIRNNINLKCYPSFLQATNALSFTKLQTFQDIISLIFILISFIIIPIIEEFYYRGIALPALIYSQNNTIVKKKKEKEKDLDKSRINQQVSFIRKNSWLLNIVLQSLSYFLINPWMLITRILSLVPQVNFAQTEANMVPSIQVQILLTGVMIVQIFIAVLKQTKLFKVNNKQKIDRAKRDKTLSAVDLNNADAL